MRSAGRDFTQVPAYTEAARRIEGGPAWLAAARRSAVETLAERGFPGRDEAWKYTRASDLLHHPFVPPTDDPRPAVLPDGPWGDAPRRVFVDGVLAPALSAGSDASIVALVDADPALLERSRAPDGGAEGFGALNQAFAQHGAVIHARAGASVEVHLVHLSTGEKRLGAVRHLIVAETGSRVTVYEHYLSLGGGGALTNPVTEVIVAAGAEVDHVRVVDEAPDALHVGTIRAGVRGRFASSSVVLGGKLVRVEIVAQLLAEGCSTQLSGLSLLRDRQHVDHHVLADHVAPHGDSEQVYRSVLDDRARSVYTGAVRVHRGATGTDSRQLHNALLLSDDAVANTRPWLEIDHDDVACAHGAAIGSLDDESLFYLRQRGLSEIEARGLLTWGFAAQTLATLPQGRVADALLDRARSWLGSGGRS